ncbi:MAG: RNA methyltransferase [Bacteroidales bacterium]|nr:RNA methyltransferase [Bacteroidales bacterium]
MAKNINQEQKTALLDHLLGFVSDNKKSLFDKIIQDRTRHITVVLEDIFQPQNASAVLRTCDCFGIHDIHIIENNNTYEVNPDVALGASKWLNLIKYNSKKENTLQAFEILQNNGYTIVATTPHKNDVLLSDLPLEKKTALIFGTELHGLSDIALKHADAFVKIPMYGFTESFNISVSAAIILHHLIEKLKSSEVNWRLNEEEKLDIMLNWARNIVKRSDIIERKFLNFL